MHLQGALLSRFSKGFVGNWLQDAGQWPGFARAAMHQLWHRTCIPPSADLFTTDHPQEKQLMAAKTVALYLAANGCDVTTVEAEEDAVQRVIDAAIQAGLGERVHAVATDLTQFTPENPLQVVVCSHSALKDLSSRERARVIDVLKSATKDGGVHLVQTILAGSAAIEELRLRYADWSTSVEPATGAGQVFLARKNPEESRVSH
jgi:hypothetical protein